MAKGALFIGWGQAVTGRERQGLQVFNAAWPPVRTQQTGPLEAAVALSMDRTKSKSICSGLR
jgi:hypothetical protein